VIHGIELHEVGKELYSCPRPASAPEPATEDLRVAPIDAELLARGDITGVDEVRDEVRQMWPSEELFLKRGMGLVALVGDRVACWCTTEYVSQRRCGIGIATHPEHRLRGIATFLAAQLAADWLRRGVTPYWDCRAENLASSRVARKAGFALVERFSMWAGRFEY
jgi:GNAT superfamily N-acetyltransferase